MAGPASELDALSHLLGVRPVDVAEEERRVVAQHEAARELQKTRAALSQADVEVARLSRAAPKEEAAATKAAEELAASRAKQAELRARVQRLEQAQAQPSSAPEELPAPAVPVSSRKWRGIVAGSSSLAPRVLDEEDGISETQARLKTEATSPHAARSSKVAALPLQESPRSEAASSSQRPPETAGTDRTRGRDLASPSPSPEAKVKVEVKAEVKREPEPLVVRPGAKICLKALKAAANLNGMKGTVLSWNSGVGRWVVKLETGDEKNVKTENLIVEEAAPSSRPSSQRKSGSEYKVDVASLVPNNSTDPHKWKMNNLNEWKEITQRGEVVSPHLNLWRGKPGQKSPGKRYADDCFEEGRERRIRREDDSSDVTFNRRQELFNKGSREPSKALAPKRQSDEGDVAMKQEEADDLSPKIENNAVMSRLQDDVVVAEGLRCPRWLWEALYPYQQKCVSWLWGLHCEKNGGILADEMGLGKTIQIAAYLATLHHSGVLQQMRVQNTSLGTALPSATGGVLILCPTTLIHQWRNELHLWYPPLRVCIMHQVDAEERRQVIHTTSTQQGVLITSYETMRNANEELLAANWVMVILDEGQKIRNPHANVTIAAKRFSTPHRIILSGSPIQNKLEELWSLFDFICPGRLGTLPVFLEEFAQPIEQGNMNGASQTHVAASYQCAMALRELTMPCILRRTKADVMDTIKLPPKQEQVLFCHLTPEQYQVYIEFLQTDQVRRARSAGRDKSQAGAAFFAISIFRKLCNHPDLLLLRADPELQPPDMGNYERSGKMKVLAEIMKLWKADGHRCLIFVQTIEMLNMLENWMVASAYTFLRFDGKTPVKKRLKMIEEFNGNADLFAMLLTTRVGGVGLNIIGANRVVIFDPDWNPMTDVQARERAWRIGQMKEVAVYRLVLTGTIEEKIYQRQVYKHFLSQKILNDPRQRQFFKWSDLHDLFDVPPAPPNFNPKLMGKMKEKYKALFKKFSLPTDDEDHCETTQVMSAIQDLPTESQNVPSKEVAAESNAILQSLYDSQGIKASFDHSKVEQPLLDRKIVREGATMIAQRALAAIRASSRECSAHHINQPTWTGQRGAAGSSGGAHARADSKYVLKREREQGPAPDSGSSRPGGRVPASDILEGLKKLSAIRSMTTSSSSSQSDDAARMGLVSRAKTESAAIADGISDVGLPIELHQSDRKIAQLILEAFLDMSIAGTDHSLTTGEVLRVSKGVPSHHADLFKTLLRQMCELSKSSQPGQPGVWVLRREFWPKAYLRGAR